MNDNTIYKPLKRFPMKMFARPYYTAVKLHAPDLVNLPVNMTLVKTFEATYSEYDSTWRIYFNMADDTTHVWLYMSKDTRDREYSSLLSTWSV